VLQGLPLVHAPLQLSKQSEPSASPVFFMEVFVVRVLILTCFFLAICFHLSRFVG
jgi:hypothetical protein